MADKKTLWMKNKNCRWWHWFFPKKYSYKEGNNVLVMWRFGSWVILRGPKSILHMVEEEANK